MFKSWAVITLIFLLNEGAGVLITRQLRNKEKEENNFFLSRRSIYLGHCDRVNANIRIHSSSVLVFKEGIFKPKISLPHHVKSY